MAPSVPAVSGWERWLVPALPSSLPVLHPYDGTDPQHERRRASSGSLGVTVAHTPGSSSRRAKGNELQRVRNEVPGLGDGGLGGDLCPGSQQLLVHLQCLPFCLFCKPSVQMS